MQGLTERQQQVLRYIRQSINDRGYPPTLREIGTHMGIRSTNGVNDHLRALERKGYLTREDMKSRALRPRDPDALPGAALSGGADVQGEGFGEEGNLARLRRLVGEGRLGEEGDGPLPANDTPGRRSDAALDATHIMDVPILGRIAAGQPLLAQEQVVDTIRIDRTLLRDGCEVFGLRVTGDSMIEAGIYSGDFIFVRKQLTAQRGDIVVALIGDEATVKYYYPEKDYIRFQPANASMAPILVRASDFRPTMLLGVVIGVYRKF